jgi:uncharacterized paraquat-inducible protein A
MNPIAQERCFNHRQREAVARCPECHRCFCRECITEHGDRVICAACLQTLAIHPTRRVAYNRLLILTASSLVSFLMLWLVFQAIGRGLLRLPSSFHEGTLWREAP